MKNKELEWLEKCLKCQHCYRTNKDSDEIKCRLKSCRFEPYKGKEIKPNEYTDRRLVIYNHDTVINNHIYDNQRREEIKPNE